MARMGTLTVDNVLMGRLLIRLEQDANRGGWDGPAALYVLYDWHDRGTEAAYKDLMAVRRGAPARCGPYAAQSMVPSDALSGIASHALFRLALNVSQSDHPAPTSFIKLMRQPGFLGVAFQCESWTRTMTSDERDAYDINVRFADLPDSKEARGVYAADVSGGVYAAQRIRGEKPWLLVPGAGDLSQFGGSVPQSLQMIVAVIADLPRPKLTELPTGWSWDQQSYGA
jgi:hypothetical protein